MALVASYHLRLRFHTWWRLTYLYSCSTQCIYTRILSCDYENIQYCSYFKIILNIKNLNIN